MTVATATEVRAVLTEVAQGLPPAEAGARLRAMNLPTDERASAEETLRGEDSTSTPGSITEVSLARARGEITPAQEDAILAAYMSA